VVGRFFRHPTPSSLSDLRKNKSIEAILIQKQTVIKPYYEGIEE
jgi:hypothetical protein